MWNVLDQMAATCGTLGTWNVLNQRSTAREMLKTYNILDLSPDVPGGILECVQDCRCVLTTANPHPKMHEGTGMALSCQGEDRATLHQDTPSFDIPGLSLLRSGVGIQPHTSRPQFPQMPRQPSRQKD